MILLFPFQVVEEDYPNELLVSVLTKFNLCITTL